MCLSEPTGSQRRIRNQSSKPVDLEKLRVDTRFLIAYQSSHLIMFLLFCADSIMIKGSRRQVNQAAHTTY